MYSGLINILIDLKPSPLFFIYTCLSHRQKKLVHQILFPSPMRHLGRPNSSVSYRVRYDHATDFWPVECVLMRYMPLSGVPPKQSCLYPPILCSPTCSIEKVLRIEGGRLKDRKSLGAWTAALSIDPPKHPSLSCDIDEIETFTG